MWDVHDRGPPPDFIPSHPRPISEAKRAIADCKDRYAAVNDYTCVFVKRERVDGRMTPNHVMHMKARTKPASIYFKFQTPNKGREAIYVAGRNQGRLVAHDVGFGKLLAGTMHLDPTGSMAMEDNRHPVTDAGIGSLIDTVAKHWNAELKAGESVVRHDPNMRVGRYPCVMIESTHPNHGPNYRFYRVRLYIDREHGLPIRFEAYDWPKTAGRSRNCSKSIPISTSGRTWGLANSISTPTTPPIPLAASDRRVVAIATILTLHHLVGRY